MGLEKVIVSTAVLDYFEDLVFILHEKDYFSYKENAIDYVDKIFFFIENGIHNFPHQKTPKKLTHLGSYYIFYKSNSRTTWYVFFENEEHQYLITYITNNHTEIAKFLKP